MQKKEDRIIRTDNIPLLDELVYQVKNLCLSCVLKDPKQANDNETKESLRDSSIYISCVENRATFDLFSYSVQELVDVGIPLKYAEKYSKSKDDIPTRYRSALLKNKVNYWLNNYVELNNYYRMLNGLPNYEDEPIYIDQNFRDLSAIDYSLPIHEQRADTIDYMYSLGLIDKLLLEYPDCEYLKHMGSRSIGIAFARKAPKFSLLYCTEDVEDLILEKFRERMSVNRDYTMKKIYSDAYKYGSDYYDNFIMVLITLQTMMDMLSELPDYIINMELFDLRTIRLMFLSYGVDYFDDIPKRYQLNMIRNIHRLIKYKSTTKNIVDICSLFGFDNIQVFKYYILKIRNKDGNGKYIFSKNEDGTDKLNDMYDLQFLKAPIDDIGDNYLHDNTKYYDYDSIVSGDKYWDGELSHEYVKTKIIEQEFNILRSEYISIDTTYSLTELSFQLSYFYNIFFDEFKYEEKLLMLVPCIDANVMFKMVDIICYMTALGYEYMGIRDDIIDTTSKALQVCGFNFAVNMDELATYIKEQGYTLKELGVDDFVIPHDQILTYKQLMYIFTQNKKIYNHLVHEMNNAENYNIYKIYKQIFDAYMIRDLNMQFFKLPDGKVASSWTEFIKYRDTILYDNLMYIKRIRNKETKMENIMENMEGCAMALQNYLDSEDLNLILNRFPIVSIEAVKHYIYEVIRFFKSFKIEILGINTIYVIDDQLENKVNILDELIMKYIFTKEDMVDIYDKMRLQLHLSTYDKINIVETLAKEITNFIDKFFYEIYNIDDKVNIINNANYNDHICINDRLGDRHNNSIKVSISKEEKLCLNDLLINSIHMKPEESIKIKDSIIKLVYSMIDSIICDNIELNEELKSLIHLSFSEEIFIKESCEIIKKRYK